MTVSQFFIWVQTAITGRRKKHTHTETKSLAALCQEKICVALSRKDRSAIHWRPVKVKLLLLKAKVLPHPSGNTQWQLEEPQITCPTFQHRANKHTSAVGGGTGKAISWPDLPKESNSLLQQKEIYHSKSFVEGKKTEMHFWLSCDIGKGLQRM